MADHIPCGSQQSLADQNTKRKRQRDSDNGGSDGGTFQKSQRMEKKQVLPPATLIVIERWGFPILGGIPAALYLLITLLRSTGLTIYCTVLEADGYTAREAKRLGVRLLLPEVKTHYKTTKPTPIWLVGHKAFYPYLEKLQNVKFIFGFGLVTSSVAYDIKGIVFPEAKFGVVNVWCPDSITKETLRYDEETFQNRCKLLDHENMSAEIILSIGPSVFDHFKFRYTNIKFKHYQLIPKSFEIYFDLPLLTVDQLPDEIRHFEILSMFEKTVIDEFSPNDTLQKAMNLMASSFENNMKDPPKWTILCTEKTSDRTIKERLDPRSNLNVYVKRLKSNDYIHELRYSHIFIMPHRSVDMFSLTMAAMASGKPVIVPAMSECDMFIRKYLPLYQDNMVVDMRSGPKDICNRIVHILQNYSMYMKHAKKVRCILQEDLANEFEKMNTMLVDEITVHVQRSGIQQVATVNSCSNTTLAYENQQRDPATVSLQISPSYGNSVDGASMCQVEGAFNQQHRPDIVCQLINGIHDDLDVLTVEKGCLRYVTHCGSSEALEALWREYTSGRLDKTIHSTIITPTLLSKIQAHYLTLDIYIPVQEYLLCKRELPLISGSVTMPCRRHSVGATTATRAVPRRRTAQNVTVDTLNLVLSRMQTQDSHPHSTLLGRDDFRVEELHHYKTTLTKTHGKVTTDVYFQEARLGAYQSKRDELVSNFTAQTTHVGFTENATEYEFIQLKKGTDKYSRQKNEELREDKEVLKCRLDKLKDERRRITEGYPVKESVLKVFGYGSMPEQLRGARGIYIKNNGQWVICDIHNHRVQVIDPIKLCCDLILQFHAFPKSFIPWNVTVDEGNDTYFMSDGGNDQVVVSSGQSKILNCFGRKEGIYPTGICLSPDGLVFIGDNKGYVRKYNKSGEHIARTEKGQVFRPWDLIANKKCIFVSDIGRKCVHVLNHQMQRMRAIGKGHLEGPCGLCFDHQQDGIYVCDINRKRVVHFNCDGEFLSYKGQGQLEESYHIALCKDNPYRLVVTQLDCIKLMYI